MTPFTVYGVAGSPYVRAALLGLEEKGAAWTLSPLTFADMKSPAYLSRHPFGRIPALEHGDFRLYETQAILRYLDRLYPTPSLTPTDARDEARMNQVCGVTDWYVMPNISAGIVFPLVVAPRLGRPIDESKIGDFLPKAEVCMAELARLLGDGAYIAGGQISIADLLLAPHMDFFTETEQGRAMFARHPNLADWLERMRARPSMAATTWERLGAPARAA